MDKWEEFKKLQLEHLSLLTSNGRSYIGTIDSALSVLESDFSGKREVSFDTKAEVLTILRDAVDNYRELIHWSIETRQNFIDAIQGEGNGDKNHIEFVAWLEYEPRRFIIELVNEMRQQTIEATAFTEMLQADIQLQQPKLADEKEDYCSLILRRTSRLEALLNLAVQYGLKQD